VIFEIAAPSQSGEDTAAKGAAKLVIGAVSDSSADMKAALKMNEALLAKTKDLKKKRRLIEKLLLSILITLSDACHVAASHQIRS